MARAKKEKLSLDELLEQALVKKKGQPYEIPSNWVWTTLEYISEIITGGTPSKNSDIYYGGNFPFIKPADLDQGRNIRYASEYLSQQGKDVSRIIPSGTTSVCCIGSIGKCGYLEFDATTNQQINSIIPKGINSLFIYYYCCSDEFVRMLKSLASATTIAIVNKSKMSGVSIPLPPLAEQQRIVERIESLFEKLDTARDLVQNALDSFENRKAAILHKAFTGELTAKWRQENGVSLESWEEKPLSEVCDAFQYGTSKKSQEQGEVVVLRMGNLQKGEIDWKNLVYTSDEEDIEKYLLKEGDVLFNRTNSAELVGKTSIYRGEYPAIFAGYLIRLKYKPCLNGEYLNYVLNSPNAKAYCNEVKSDGVNQSNINAKKIGQFIIPICKIEEQQEIVKIVSQLLDNEQQAEGLCDIIEKIDLMKKSILARAFRGELGTNNPEEESAENLLREILIKRLQANQ